MEEVKYSERINEKLYIRKLPSGLTCYILPKKGYVEKQAVVAVNYGSIDTSFTVNGKDLRHPDGTAHFMEHKLFEDEEKNIYDCFSKQGAFINAFTNQTSTAYYFTCIDNFDINFRLLLEMVRKPYFTDENVAKEMDIIDQEIKMYKDNPYWRAYFNMLGRMYESSPVGREIAGTVESIQEINKEILYEAYDAFYRPSNMAVICIGDIEPEKIFEMSAELIPERETPELKRHYGSHGEGIEDREIRDKMSLSLPMYSLGYKDRIQKGSIVDRITSSRVLLEAVFGDSTDLYGTLYNEGVIDPSFSYEYGGGPFYGVLVFSGVSKNPERFRDRVMEETARIRKEGLSSERFERILKKMEGRFIRHFNVIDQLVTAQVDLFSKGTDLFELLESYLSVKAGDCERRVGELFQEENMVFSVVE